MAAPILAANTILEFLLAFLILAVTYLVNFVFGRLVIGAVSKKNRSVAYEVGSIGGIVIWIAGVLFTLPVLGASDTVVSVVILLVGAFLILATRDFIGNWFAGQTIKKIIPFRIGDWIKTSESYGRVVKIDDLYTTLVTEGNESVVIPNVKLTSDTIVDRTTNGYLNVPVEVDVPSEVELAALLPTISEIASDLSARYADLGEDQSPEIQVLSQTPASVKIRVMLKLTNPSREEEAKSEFRKRMATLRWPERIKTKA